LEVKALGGRIKRFYILSLGCPKNEIDSDVLSSSLMRAGWQMANRPTDAELLIVNTCSFIVPAVEEAIGAILELSSLKESGERKLAVVGCMVARYGPATLSSLLPEVDVFVGQSDYPRFVTLINSAFSHDQAEFGGHMGRQFSSTMGKGYVYVKICEGCSRKCSFCTIPAIRGPLRSRRWEEIREEAGLFIKLGAREIVLVAQDTTSYGSDIYGAPSLGGLIERLLELEGDFRLRIMYMHPQGMDAELLRTMRDSRVCSYFDIPLQHVDRCLLKAMGREGGYGEYRRLIEMIRDAFGDVALRSTFMVGFPGEDGASFRELRKFIEQTRFDWLGLFRYSQEEGTPAYTMKPGVPAEVSKRRLQFLAELQEEIMLEKAQNLIGRRFQVLAEGKSLEAPGYWEARSWREAPEVDGTIFLPDEPGLTPGNFYDVVITGVEGIDLVGALKGQDTGIHPDKGRGQLESP
jgi:ribosomal protein S12 methylthiotransferase